MRREQLEMAIGFGHSPKYLASEHMLGFCAGWAIGFLEFGYNQMNNYTLNTVSDDLPSTYVEDWELHMVINYESMSVDVVGYPYVSEDREYDLSMYTVLHSEPITFNKIPTVLRERF